MLEKYQILVIVRVVFDMYFCSMKVLNQYYYFNLSHCYQK